MYKICPEVSRTHTSTAGSSVHNLTTLLLLHWRGLRAPTALGSMDCMDTTRAVLTQQHGSVRPGSRRTDTHTQYTRTHRIVLLSKCFHQMLLIDPFGLHHLCRKNLSLLPLRNRLHSAWHTAALNLFTTPSQSPQAVADLV